MQTETARSHRERFGRCASRSAAGALAALLLALLGACSEAARTHQPEPPAAPLGRGALTRARLRELRASEQELRAELVASEQPPWIDVSGADPYRLVPRDSGFVGILRGAKALVSLDAELDEQARVPLPEAPTALCLRSGDEAVVASRYGREIERVLLGGAGRRLAAWVSEASGVADLACGADGLVYVLPASGGDLLTLDQHGSVLGRYPALGGGLRLALRGRYLLESSLFERTLRVLELDARGVPSRELARIHHDGPIWGFDALARDSELLIAVSGVEDAKLVRVHGEFENIDSFVWLYRYPGRGPVEQLAALNVSDHGLVLPKAIALRESHGELTLSALASGSGALLRARFAGSLRSAPELTVEPALPGASDAVFAERAGRPVISYASPLLDAWLQLEPSGVRVARVDPQTRPEPRLRLGEALFFSELMAPDNLSAGQHSRFSCETCHFEGGLDGRVHYTGRADVSVVTKPLFGLANNRPHFSRALDPDLSAVSHNEFRVAGAGSGTDPWFSLRTARFPWLQELGIARAELSPLELREALLAFLYTFSHAPNPRAQGRSSFSALEASGAASFLEHCAGCHAARLSSDEPASELPLAAWEGRVLSRNSPIVWARGEYAKTGVVPYVEARGTRIPSLRRLALKPRYFTNGSAPSLMSVLERFRGGPEGGLHDGEGQNLAPLPPSEQRALLAFLQLL